jgi:ketosteroid isomerase-like protein
MNARFMLASVAALLVVAMAANAQDSTENEVQKAMDDNFAAIIHKDAAALNRQYTDDYFRIDETGNVTGKAEFIAGITNPDYETTRLQASDVKIRVYGNIAVVTELLTATAGPTGSTHREHVSRQTTVWLKQDGVWKKHVFQMTVSVRGTSYLVTDRRSGCIALMNGRSYCKKTERPR